MHFRAILLTTILAFTACCLQPAVVNAQTAPSGATFRAGVDLVSVAAVVRDKKGRVVRTLTADDFTVTDADQPRAIVNLHADDESPASVALLIDGSGSMRLNQSIQSSRWICEIILHRLQEAGDLAALMSFDTRLVTLREFTSQFDEIRAGLADLNTFGSTSIYDAIAGTAAAVAARTQQRRAIVVVTDGSDNASRYSPQDVARIASTIDVPVYVFAVGDMTADETSGEDAPPPLALAELAHATGGDYFRADSPARAHHAVTRLLDELRHQYQIVFEPEPGTDLRRIDVRTKQANLIVRARTWYAPGSTD